MKMPNSTVITLGLSDELLNKGFLLMPDGATKDVLRNMANQQAINSGSASNRTPRLPTAIAPLAKQCQHQRWRRGVGSK